MMIKKIKIIIFFTVSLSTSVLLQGQETDKWNVIYDSTAATLSRLEDTIPGLNQKINISITETTLNEFLRAVANTSGINMNISPNLTQNIVNNFSDVKISDMLLFLCNQFRLSITSIGNIIDISPYNEPSVKPVCVLNYKVETGKITIETEGEELGSLSKKLTIASGINVIPAPGLNSQKVTSFILELPFSEAIDKLAYSNNLTLKVTENNVFLLERKQAEKPEGQNQRGESGASYRAERESNPKLLIKVLGEDSLSIYAEKMPVIDVIRALSEKTSKNYLFTSAPMGEITTSLKGVTFQDAINALVRGSGLLCKKSGDIYIIGEKSIPALMTQSMIQLQYRSVDSIINIIPKDVISEIQILEYREQNGLLLSGPGEKVTEAEKFIRSIDKLVPVVSIEVLIIDYTKRTTDETGIKAGIGTSPIEKSSGSVFPSVGMTMSSESINNLISRFNGFGWAKIGQVTPDFYASLKALESQDIVKIRSTPILSTLNGHKAIISIGETEYYVEESQNIYSTTSTQTQTTKTYKSVNADLTVTITPHVSGDDQITLDIDVEQSTFTDRITETAPPGEVTRKFKSQIRVKNGEMILLGGLEENRKDKYGEGTPLLSRIPVIKWLFSYRKETDSQTKLNVFIKPSIIN